MALEADAGRLRQSRRTLGRRALLTGAVLLLVVGAIVVAIAALGGDDNKSGKLTGNSKDSYTLSYPASWRPLSGAELDKLPGHPLAVLRRKDGKGFVVLRKEGRAPKSFGAFSGDLSRALDKRVPDFKKGSSKVITVNGDKAFFLSYIRQTKGTVHTVVVVPAGKRSYVLNTVSRGGARDVARQVARIILSFKT